MKANKTQISYHVFKGIMIVAVAIVFLIFSAVIGTGYGFLAQEPVSWGIENSFFIGVGFIIVTVISIFISMLGCIDNNRIPVGTLLFIWGWFLSPVITHWIGVFVGYIGYTSISGVLIEYQYFSLLIPFMYLAYEYARYPLIIESNNLNKVLRR